MAMRRKRERRRSEGGRGMVEVIKRLRCKAQEMSAGQ